MMMMTMMMMVMMMVVVVSYLVNARSIRKQNINNISKCFAPHIFILYQKLKGGPALCIPPIRSRSFNIT